MCVCVCVCLWCGIPRQKQTPPRRKTLFVNACSWIIENRHVCVCVIDGSEQKRSRKEAKGIMVSCERREERSGIEDRKVVLVLVSKKEEECVVEGGSTIKSCCR